MALTVCIALGATGSCLWPSMLAVTADEIPQGGASMFGMLVAMGNFGDVVMPWLVGVTADATNMRWGLATATLCPLAMVFLLVWIRRNTPRVQTVI